MVLKFEVIRRSYAVSVHEPDFLNLIESERVGHDETKLPNGMTLLEKLEEIGVTSIEYDGPYGPAIFFDILADDDTEERRARIGEAIADHLRALASIR